MKTIYNAILTRLKTVSGIAWIDLDIGQLTVSPPPVAFPCVLISIQLPKAKDITDKIQDCTGNVKVKIAFNALKSTSAATPEITRENSLKVYDTIADVFKALQGFGTANFASLSRTRQGDEQRNGMFISTMEFATEFEDNTANI